MSLARDMSSALGVLVLISVALSPISALVGIAPNAAAYSDIEIDLDLPEYAAMGQKVSCTLRIAGGPAGDLGGNYSWTASIFEYENRTGFAADPSTGSSSASGVYNVTFTMPGEGGQTIKIRIVADSKEFRTGENESAIGYFSIKVVEPIVIKAQVYNAGEVDAANVTAKFYADGQFLGSKMFNLTAGSAKVLSYNWTFLSIKDGRHVITVVIDDANGLVEFSDGNNVLSQTIYVGDQGNPVGAILTLGVLVASVFVGLMWMQKPARKKK